MGGAGNESSSSIGVTRRSSLRTSGVIDLGSGRRVILRGLRGAGGRLARGGGRGSAPCGSGGLVRSGERVRDGIVGSRSSAAESLGSGSGGCRRERNLAAGLVDDGTLVHGVDHGT